MPPVAVAVPWASRVLASEEAERGAYDRSGGTQGTMEAGIAQSVGTTMSTGRRIGGRSKSTWNVATRRTSLGVVLSAKPTTTPGGTVAGGAAQLGQKQRQQQNV